MLLRLSLVSFFLFFTVINIYSQWELVGPLPQPNTLNTVHFVSAATAWAGGKAGTLMKTTDGGLTWMIQTINPNLSINDIDFIDQNTGYACISDGSILKTTNGGDDWQKIPSGTNSYLNSISFLDKNYGITCGYGTILSTTDGGESWNHQQMLWKNFSGAAYISSQTAVIAANYEVNDQMVYSIYRTTDGGITWNEQLYGMHGSLSRIFFIDSLNGWVGSSLGALKTTNGGLTWASYGPGTRISDVCFINYNEGTVVGNNGFVGLTTDGGLTWRTTTAITIHPLSSISFSESGHGIVVGYWGTILNSTDFGKTWNLTTKNSFDNLNKVWFGTKNTGYAVGDNGTVIKTINGGKDWFSVNVNTTNKLVDVFFWNENLGWTIDDVGYVYRTTNGGSEWMSQPAEINSPPIALSFGSATTGIILGWMSYVISLTSDGGLSWSYVIPSYYDVLQDVFFADSNTVYAIGENGRILKSTNAGLSWHYTANAGTTTLKTIHFTDKNNGWTGGSWGNMFKTTNGGDEWIRSQSFSPNEIFFVDQNNGFFLDNIFRTTDGGNTWTQQDTMPVISHGLKSIYMTDSFNGVVVGEGGIILRMHNEVVRVSDEAEINFSFIPGQFELSQNYPNPFNPSTLISCSIPVETNVELEIYNALGKKVSTLIDEIKTPGIYTIEFNAADLPSGIYFYRLTAGDYKQTRKMVLIK